MALVPIRINNRDYEISCDDGQEEQLRVLSYDVDDRVRALAYQMGGNIGEVMGLVMAALMMADEIVENKKEIKSVVSEVKRMSAMVDSERKQVQNTRIMEIEAAMAATLEEITLRIEKIADRIEMR